MHGPKNKKKIPEDGLLAPKHFGIILI